MIGRRPFLVAAAVAPLAWSRSSLPQDSQLPVVGFLGRQSPEGYAHLVAAFHAGLNESGYVEGRNVAVVYRWAADQIDRLPALAAELAERPVDVIFASGGDAPALAAKAATATIPIVFSGARDAVQDGLVASFNRPGGNVTGVNVFGSAVEQKRLGLLHELLPSVDTLFALLNHTATAFLYQSSELPEAARRLGVQLHIVTASNEAKIDAAFAAIAQDARALLVGTSTYFLNHRDQIVAHAARHRIPTIYDWREYVVAGGLISYGTSLPAAYRQAGVYVGRILGGEQPADMPVLQLTEFECVLNLRTAAALGITVPPSILLQATEVIE